MTERWLDEVVIPTLSREASFYMGSGMSFNKSKEEEEKEDRESREMRLRIVRAMPLDCVQKALFRPELDTNPTVLWVRDQFEKKGEKGMLLALGEAPSYDELKPFRDQAWKDVKWYQELAK